MDVCRGSARAVRFVIPAGVTLTQGITDAMIAAGFQSGTVVLHDAMLSPFQFVMPGPPDGPAHVAYFTAPVAPAGITRVRQANATFGFADGIPFLHCHAAWTEADGRVRGGHILPRDTVLAAPCDGVGWGFTDIRVETAPDTETGFTLFQPHGSGAGDGLFARIKPNEDILVAIEALGVRDATVRGSLGSLIGACFTDGRRVDDIATEVLVRQGWVRDGIAALELYVVDMQGSVHQGWLQRGENPVCITFDLVLAP
jgi:hypothetical protein